jgi:hypothetical protein
VRIGPFPQFFCFFRPNISKIEFLWHVWHHLVVSDQYGWYGSQMAHTGNNMPEFFSLPFFFSLMGASKGVNEGILKGQQ